MTATFIPGQLLTIAADEAPKARVWNVRIGSTGTGIHAFDVYTTDMGEARIAAENTIRHLPQEIADLFTGGFTVHEIKPGHRRVRTLARNPFLAHALAPDFTG